MARLKGLRPAAELAADRPHGTRLRYLGGCKCEACRGAANAYERERRKARLAGGWNGFVDAAPVRAKLQRLSAKGLGLRQVAAIADCSAPVLVEIKGGRQHNVRAQIAKRVLAIKAPQKLLADHALVPAASTWRLLDQLREHGYTKRALSQMLGGNRKHLQVGKVRTTVKTRAAVARLHKRLTT